MATVVLTSTADPTRAAQVSFERWQPALAGSEQVTVLVPSDENPIGAEFFRAVIAQVQQHTPAVVTTLVEARSCVPRSLAAMSSRLAVSIVAIDEMNRDDLEPRGGWRVPRLLGPGAFVIQLVSAAAAAQTPYQGLALAKPDRFLVQDDEAGERSSALTAWQPQMIFLNAIGTCWDTHPRPVDLVALSDDRRAIDAVALGLWWLRGGERSGVPLGDVPAIAGAPGNPLDLKFDTEGVDAATWSQNLRDLL